MSDLEYDISIICDEHPKSRRTASTVKRRLSSFSYRARLNLGGALFCPRQVTNANLNLCTGALIRSRQVIAVLSSTIPESNAAKAAEEYQRRTGRKPVYICSDIKSLKKAEERCPFFPVYTGKSIAWPVVFNSARAELKTELAGETWDGARRKRLKVSRTILSTFLVLVLLVVTVGGIGLMKVRQEDNVIPEMDASVLLSQSHWGHFVSDDGTLYGDMQTDGSLLVRRTEDNTIVQTIDTMFIESGGNVQFSADNRKVLVCDGDAAALYDIEADTEAFRLPKYADEDLPLVARFVNGGQWIAAWQNIWDGEVRAPWYWDIGNTSRVDIFDAANGDLLYTYADESAFALYGFTTDGGKIVGHKGENELWTWDFASGTEAYNSNAYAQIEGRVSFRGFSPDGRYYLKTVEQDKLPGRSVDTVATVRACADMSVLSTIQFSGRGYSSVYFDAAGRVFVLKADYMALYDQFTGKRVWKIAAPKDSYFTGARLIDGTRYALCYTKVFNEQTFFINAIDTANGRTVAQRPMDGYFESIQLFPETQSIIVTTQNNGYTALRFQYDIRDDGIHFED